MRALILVSALLAPSLGLAAPTAARDCDSLPYQSQQLACISAQIRAIGERERAAAQSGWLALCQRRGDIRIGLDYEGLKKSCWGTRKPSHINTTYTPGHKHEQWVYGNSYVYFTDGVITSYQQFTRP